MVTHIDAPATDVPAHTTEDKVPVCRPHGLPCCGGVMMLTGVLPRLVPERSRLRDDSS